MGFDTEQPGAQPDSTLTNESGSQQPNEMIVDNDLDLANGELQDDQQPEAEEFEEIELDDGVKKVPKSLREYVMRNKDYTLKTQALATERSQLATERQQAAQHQQFMQANVQDIAQLISMDRQLQQYQQINWDALQDADPGQAQKLERQWRMLEGERTKQAQKLAQSKQRMDMEAEQATATRRQKLQAELVRDIPSLSNPEVQKGVYATLKAAGYEDHHINTVDFAPFIKLAHKAFLYDKLAKERKPAAEPAKPTTTVGGPTRAATGYSPTMSDAEFNKMRRAQIARRRR